MTSDADPATLARQLHDAYTHGKPTSAGQFAGLTVDEGYAIQEAFLSARLEAEGPAVGYKLGFTNETVQQEFGVTEPVYGRVLAATVDVDQIQTAGLIAPRAEPEIVVRLGKQLPGAASQDEIKNAVAAVAPAIEIVDTRTGSWNLAPGLAVADNSLAARLVTGSEQALSEVEPLTGVQVRLSTPDVKRTGRGSAVLGDPLQAVAWLSRTLGEPLGPGTLVSTGSLTGTVPVRNDKRVAASFSGLGDVSIQPA